MVRCLDIHPKSEMLSTKIFVENIEDGYPEFTIGDHNNTFIPQYSKPGDRIYLDGLGWNGGDLELEIVIKENNNYFLDSKFNLHYILEIDLWESILGVECEFRVFDEDIKCNIKPFTKTGDLFLLIGKGYPNGRYKTNLIIEIKVKKLITLNEEQLELIRKIKEIGEQ